jgi:pimeloyl-ACP methyl ester carboxylesterase
MGIVTTYGVGQYASGYASEAHTAVWDRAYKSGGRGMIFGHLATGNSQYLVGQAGMLPIDAALASFGPIMAGDFGGDQWGNSEAQTLVGDAWAWLKSQYGAKTDRVVLIGLSMGALNVLNWARANPTLVKAIVLFYPVVNLQAMYNGTGGASNEFESSINTAYGGVPNYSTYDPASNASSYTGVPIRMYYSTADTTVGTANQTAFESAVGGSAFSSASLGAAAHGDMTQPSVKDIASWVSQYS